MQRESVYAHRAWLDRNLITLAVSSAIAMACSAVTNAAVLPFTRGDLLLSRATSRCPVMAATSSLPDTTSARGRRHWAARWK